MIVLALDVLAFLFLLSVVVVALGLLACMPRRAWRILGILAAAFGLLLLYAISPEALGALAGLAGMFGLAALICLGLDRLCARGGNEPKEL